MTEVEQLKERIGKLIPQQLAKSEPGFWSSTGVWDAQIEAAAKAGNLDGLPAEAPAYHKVGKAVSLRHLASPRFWVWSLRVGDHYRALGTDVKEGIYWV